MLPVGLCVFASTDTNTFVPGTSATRWSQETGSPSWASTPSRRWQSPKPRGKTEARAWGSACPTCGWWASRWTPRERVGFQPLACDLGVLPSLGADGGLVSPDPGRGATGSVSPQEEEELRTLAATPDVYASLARSLAPSIYGSDDLKRAITCLLFGGSRKRCEGWRGATFYSDGRCL